MNLFNIVASIIWSDQNCIMYINFSLLFTLVVDLFNCEYRELKILVRTIRFWSVTSYTWLIKLFNSKPNMRFLGQALI